MAVVHNETRKNVVVFALREVATILEIMLSRSSTVATLMEQKTPFGGAHENISKQL